MIALIIKAASFKKANHQIKNATTNLIELRLDLFEKIEIDQIKKLKDSFQKDFIFTLRSKKQKGSFKLSEEKRLLLIEKLCSLNPTYLDIEYHVRKSFIKKIKKLHPKIKIIISYHNFRNTPKDLNKLLDKLRNPFSTYIKIATKTTNVLDALRMLKLSKENKNLIVIGIGEFGYIVRVLNKIYNSPFTYAAINENSTTTKDQLTIDDIKKYNYEKLNRKSKVLALIASPIKQSIGDITYNTLFKKLNINAVYIKFKVSQNELDSFFNLCKNLNIQGLSVSIPFKEKVLSYVDQISNDAKNIKAINTIKFKNDKLFGFNTDHLGFIKALNDHINIRNKKVLIIGAGGASRAIIYALKNQNADIYLINRTLKKAIALKDEFNINIVKENEIEKLNYDLIINATSSSMPIDKRFILSNKKAMDISIKPKDTNFLQIAKKKNNKVIYGYEFFLYQGLEQMRIFLNFKNIEEILRKIVEDIINKKLN
jgi:3-dehydroquinate dehydratase/shikimate dehydrogenase